MLKSVIMIEENVSSFITYAKSDELDAILSPFLDLEERQKKKRQQKEKRSAEDKTSLQRSKTFVNLLFRKERKEKSRSKSPSPRADKGEGTVTGKKSDFFFFF